MQAIHREPPVLVTGGSGTLGRLVVARLRDAGRPVRVLSRGRLPRDPTEGVEFVTADLASGKDVEPAVAGIDVVLHVAGSATGDGDKARTLARAASDAGVRHLVYISVVGADRIPVETAVDRAMFGYFAAKLEAERVVAGSGVPWTTLRVTQLHDLTFKTVAGMARLPLIPVPAGWRFQPVDAGEVADRLVELALARPAGLVPEIGGPRIYEMTDLLRSYLEATGRRRPIVPMPLPGKAAAAFRAGANLVPDRAIGRRTWEDYLQSRISAGLASLRV